MIEAPDLLFQEKNEKFKDGNYLDDLSLSYFVHHLMHPRYSEGVAQAVLRNPPRDIETIVKRQDILDEINASKGLIAVLGDVNESLAAIDFRDYRDKESTIMNYLTNSELYVDAVRKLADLGDMQSAGLGDLVFYATDVASSPDFHELSQLVDELKRCRSFEVGINLDRRLDPTEMVLLGASKRGIKSSGHPVIGLDGWQASDLKRLVCHWISEHFSRTYGKYMDQIEQTKSLIEPLDYYLSAANLFQELKKAGFPVTRPEIAPMEDRAMHVKNAVNPLLLGEVFRNGHRLVANDIHSSPDENLFVITGPNNGGKTCYVKTAGLMQLLAQCGLYVTADEARVSVRDNIFTHFVSPDDITKGEGRYLNELRRMKEVFERVTPYSMVILDEPCGGTSYQEGKEQSLVILDALHHLGPTTYFTTHIHDLAREVDNGRFKAATNLHADIIERNGEVYHTYKILPGASGKSYGTELAAQMGLSRDSIRETIDSRVRQGELPRELLR